MDAKTQGLLEQLDAEAQELVFRRFDEEDALALGQRLVKLAIAARHPVVIDIRTEGRCLFHAALPGSQALNDLWARRKSATALTFGEASMRVALRHRATGGSLAKHGLSEATHAESGGAVPIRIRHVGIVAVVTVSGLPEEADHALVIQALRAQMAE